MPNPHSETFTVTLRALPHWPKNEGAKAGGKKGSPRDSFLELRDKTPTLKAIGGAKMEPPNDKGAKERLAVERRAVSNWNRPTAKFLVAVKVPNGNRYRTHTLAESAACRAQALAAGSRLALRVGRTGPSWGKDDCG